MIVKNHSKLVFEILPFFMLENCAFEAIFAGENLSLLSHCFLLLLSFGGLVLFFIFFSEIKGNCNASSSCNPSSSSDKDGKDKWYWLKRIVLVLGLSAGSYILYLWYTTNGSGPNIGLAASAASNIAPNVHPVFPQVYSLSFQANSATANAVYAGITVNQKTFISSMVIVQTIGAYFNMISYYCVHPDSVKHLADILSSHGPDGLSVKQEELVALYYLLNSMPSVRKDMINIIWLMSDGHYLSASTRSMQLQSLANDINSIFAVIGFKYGSVSTNPELLVIRSLVIRILTAVNPTMTIMLSLRAYFRCEDNMWFKI